MNIVCFETLMKTKDWDKPSYGIVPNYEATYLIDDYTIMDVTFRRGTRQLLVSASTIKTMDGEDFDNWYKEQVKGFVEI